MNQPERKIYLPTKAEIERACEEIQASWTPRERYLRAKGWNTEAPPKTAGLKVLMLHPPGRRIRKRLTR